MGRVGITLIGVAGALLVLHVITMPIRVAAEPPWGIGTLRLLAQNVDLDAEGGIAAWFSSTLWTLAAALAGAAAWRHRMRTGKVDRGWAGLAILFLLLSLDETAQLHELAILPLRKRLGLGGVFYFGWVLAAIPFLAVVAAVYLPWMWRLPRETRASLLLAGAIFVSGAVGMEMIAGPFAEAQEATGKAASQIGIYHLCATLEETLELTGLIILAMSLAAHLERRPREAAAPGPVATPADEGVPTERQPAYAFE